MVIGIVEHVSDKRNQVDIVISLDLGSGAPMFHIMSSSGILSTGTFCWSQATEWQVRPVNGQVVATSDRLCYSGRSRDEGGKLRHLHMLWSVWLPTGYINQQSHGP